MIHECIVCFHDKKLFQDQKSGGFQNFELHEEYTVSIEMKRTTLMILNNDDGSKICEISAKYIQSNPLKHGQKDLILYNIPSSPKDQKNPVFTLKASKKCLRDVSQLTSKNKTFKFCLAFVPSQVQHISILSGQSSEQKYRGFLNLIGIMFIILNVRNIIDNFVKYGVKFQNDPADILPYHVILASIGLLWFPFVSFVIQRIRFLKIMPFKFCRIMLWLNIGGVLAYNIVYCRTYTIPPFVSIFFTSFCMIICLKLISFMHVNEQLFFVIQRFKAPELIKNTEQQKADQKEDQAFAKGKSNKKKQPQKKQQSTQQSVDQYMFSHYQISQHNLKLIHKFAGKWQKIISIWSLAEYIFAPTLCYQLEYPRTQKIRKIWLLKRIIQSILVSTLQIILWFQYINPELDNLYETITKDNVTFLEIFNRHLRLAVPNCIMWIAGFYNCFHLMLNISAEILKFSDRNFYMDWWNCRTLEQYWKTWNLPVHFWFIRHVYNPLLQRGFSKATANFIVFFISALAHQYVVSVPLKLFTWWAFLAMMSQAPIIIIQKKFGKVLNIANSQLGNVSFWISFCFVGQPIVVFIYYVIYMKKYTIDHSFFQAIPLDITL